ncbi:thioredoxin family protein [Isoptericola halotolerans]|uniref:thioredoxin family protein n=1 Tax=Isoptericola halotolerans TaxID=300560 RepID=UPI00388F2C60
MEITLLYFDDCPSWKTADDRLAEAVVGRDDVHLTRRRVTTPEEAVRLGFHGSPSILVDGVDPFAEPGADTGLACRIYRTPEGPAGSPTVGQLRDALAAASR